MSHITMTEDEVQAHRERVRRQMIERGDWPFPTEHNKEMALERAAAASNSSESQAASSAPHREPGETPALGQRETPLEALSPKQLKAFRKGLSTDEAAARATPCDGVSRSIELVLPYPVSANRYWRSFTNPKTGRAIVTVSKEAERFKEHIRDIAIAKRIFSPLGGRVAVEIKLYPPRPKDAAKRMKKNPDAWDDTVQCIDLDNARKVLYDALKGVAFVDDKWIFSDSGRRMEPDGEGRVEVRISQIVVESRQEALL